MDLLKFTMKIFAMDCSGCEEKTTFCSSITRKVVTGFIVGVLNFYSLYYKVLHSYNYILVSIKATDGFQTVFDFCQYLMDLHFIHKYGRAMMGNYNRKYMTIDKILNVTEEKFVNRRMMKIYWIFILIWFVSSFCDFCAWYLSYGLYIPIAYSISYMFVLIKILTTLDLSAQVLRLEWRLKVLGYRVYTCYKSTPDLLSTRMDITFNDPFNQNWFHDVRCGDARKTKIRGCLPGSNTQNNCEELKWLNRCYLILVEQTMFINKMFGIRITLNSLSMLIDMIRYANIAVRLAIGTQQTLYDSSYFPAVSSFLRLLCGAAVLISLVYHCEEAYSQQNGTLNIIDNMLTNKNMGQELQLATSNLQTLMESRPISFNMANFFSLNYSFLLSTISIFTTYTIILLQSVN